MSDALQVCVLTPPGRGAVATISLSGASAAGAIERCVRSATPGGAMTPIAAAPVGQIRLGVWGSTAGEHVVVCRCEPDRFEIHCHGGAAAIEAILNDLVAVGAQRIDWRDWIAEEAPGRVAGEALIALASARTERTAAILLDQTRGALQRELRAAQGALADGQIAAGVSLLETLVDRGRVGLHLVEPFRVTLAGAPNVGKSSLINTLVGYERAIVYHEPGTTRDVLTAHTAIAGWPVELSDTAGMRASDDELEQAGVARARTAAHESDLVLLVRDASVPVTATDEALRAELPAALVVRNKSDLLSAGAANADEDDLLTSALTGAGIDGLLSAIGQRLVPVEIPAGAGVPFTREQITAIERAADAVKSGNALLAVALLVEWAE